MRPITLVDYEDNESGEDTPAPRRKKTNPKRLPGPNGRPSVLNGEIDEEEPSEDDGEEDDDFYDEDDCSTSSGED